MKRVHLLEVDAGAQEFRDLIEAGRQQGLRFGWLDCSEPSLPPQLSEAAAAGVVRAVAAGETTTVTVKIRRGPPVLGDLLRQHFRGCDAILVLGSVGAPKLRTLEGGWCIESPHQTSGRLSANALIARLARPGPLLSPEQPVSG